MTGENPGADDFTVVRGEDGIREVTVEIQEHRYMQLW